MRCPKCSSLRDKVVDSRATSEGDCIRRRRACLDCGHRYTTHEEVVRVNIRVVKRDGSHEALDTAKLRNGMLRACEKRPVSLEQIDAMAAAIVAELDGEYDKEVPSSVIGEKVMQKLEKTDEVAYVRFASVYRRFKDVNQFMSEIKGLIGK